MKAETAEKLQREKEKQADFIKSLENEILLLRRQRQVDQDMKKKNNAVRNLD